MAKGFSGVPGNMQGLLKQAQKMQEQLKKAQESAKLLTAEESSGGGVVTVVANGENQIVSITINPEVVDPKDVEMIQDLVLAASNAALRKVQAMVEEALGKVTSGIQIPGLM